MSWHKLEYQNSVLGFYFRGLQAVCLCCFSWVAQVYSSNASFFGLLCPAYCLCFLWSTFLSVIYFSFHFQEKIGRGLLVYTTIVWLCFTWVEQCYVVWPQHRAEFYTIACITKEKQKMRQSSFLCSGLGGLILLWKELEQFAFYCQEFFKWTLHSFTHTHIYIVK